MVLCRRHDPPEVTLPPPKPPPPGGLAGAWNPLWLLDELLLELPDEPLPPEPPDEDEDEDDEVPPPEVVAAWLVPGRTAATTPAAATLAMVTVTVAAFTRRRPSSRSATARAIRTPVRSRAAGSAGPRRVPRCPAVRCSAAPVSPYSCQLFTPSV